MEKSSFFSAVVLYSDTIIFFDAAVRRARRESRSPILRVKVPRGELSVHPGSTGKRRLSNQGFNTDGPDSGNLITPGIVLASTDLVAADTVGLALLKVSGAASAAVWNHPTIRRGVEVHSPWLSPATLKLIAEGVDNIDDIKAQLRL